MDSLIQLAYESGFDLAAGCLASDLHDEHLRNWLEQGYHASMQYLNNHLETRENINSRFEWTQSALVLAVNYTQDKTQAQPVDGFGWSSYAWGDDYHDSITTKLKALAQAATTHYGDSFKCHYYVDTGPVSERLAASKAGLGWIGKNGMFINQQQGSWFFLAVLLTNIEIATPPPAVNRCGTCNKCITACPTNAIIGDAIIDANKCISYLTIEKRNDFSDADFENFHDQFFGCDICQDVCPWNCFAVTSSWDEFALRPAYTNLSLGDLIDLNVENYQKLFQKSALKRSKHEGLVRNAIIVAANTSRTDCLKNIHKHLDSSSSAIKQAAQWATNKLTARS